jgi:hypothetical protein
VNTRRRARGDEGWAVSEAVLLMPVALIAIGFLLVCARLALAQLSVSSAARDAARAASLERSYDAAATAAEASATSNLGDACRGGTGHATIVSGEGSFEPGGIITVTVVCDADLTGVAIPGIPATSRITKSSTEVIDRYRSMGG